MKYEKLKKSINDSWGHYSQQAMAFKAMEREIRDLKSRLKDAEHMRTDASSGRSHIPEPSDVAKLTATYFLTRAFIISGVWIMFFIFFFAIAGGTMYCAAKDFSNNSIEAR